MNALLDVVAVEAEDQVTLLLGLAAPSRKGDKERRPATPQVVLDRSGSMGGGQLDAAKEALDALVTRLDPADNFGLVVFDDTVDEAAGRVPNAIVRTELAFQVAQRSKRNAADALRRGDIDAASAAYDGAGRTLQAFACEAAPAMASEIAAEADLLLDLSERARFEDSDRMAKFADADRKLKERKRGRRAADENCEDA